MNTLWHKLTRPHSSITDFEQQSQSRLLAMTTLAICGALVIAIIIGAFDPSRSVELRQSLLRIYATLIGIVTTLYFLNRAGKYRLSALAFVGIIFIFVHLPLLPTSILPAGNLFFIAIVLLVSSIFLALRATIALAFASLVVQFIFLLIEPRSLSVPSSGGIAFTIVAAGVILIFLQHRTEVERKRRSELEAANSALRASEMLLEKRVAERTRDLEIAADVSKQVTTILDLHQLLAILVERTRSAFDLYHTSVFLYDANSDELNYEAGTGEAGQRLKMAGKKFRRQDPKGLVPLAGRTLQAVLVNDVASDPNHLVNPDLPQTRAELVLPMYIGDQLVGVLDLQSEKLARFTPDDLKVLTSLAEQLAVAVQNARFYGEQVEIAEKLRAVDTVKSQFLASMSHELRTPLNAILNFTEFVAVGLLGPVTEKQKDALTKALDSGRHLLSLINDVLDMTKIEAGMLKLFVETEIDLTQELGALIPATQTLLNEKPVTFVQDIDEGLPLLVGDRRRIRQILLNLLSNAAKFTEEGTVTLRVERCEDEVLFTVTDTGPGIAAEDQELIFEPFKQTETGIQHAAGTGLGLPISRKLVEAHGGQLWVESTPGNGAAFHFNLPIHSLELIQTIEVTVGV